VLAQDWAKVSCDSSVFRINFDGTLDGLFPIPRGFFKRFRPGSVQKLKQVTRLLA